MLTCTGNWSERHDQCDHGLPAARMNNRDYREAYEAAVKQERTDDAGVTVHVQQIEKEP